jgi:hypothetical protein
MRCMGLDKPLLFMISYLLRSTGQRARPMIGLRTGKQSTRRSDSVKRRDNWFQALRTHVEAACDSHRRGLKSMDSLRRALPVLVKLLRAEGNRKSREEFVGILEACADDEFEVYLDRSGALYVHGWLSTKELGERVVWGNKVEVIDGN